MYIQRTGYTWSIPGIYIVNAHKYIPAMYMYIPDISL